MIIIIKKNDSFEIVRPIYHLHTHAYTHIRVFYSFFIIIIFFFFRPLGVPRRVEKWGSENGKTTKMWHGRWSGLGGTRGGGWKRGRGLAKRRAVVVEWILIRHARNNKQKRERERGGGWKAVALSKLKPNRPDWKHDRIDFLGNEIEIVGSISAPIRSL